MEQERRDKRQANWFWMNKSIIDDYGATIGGMGIAVYAILARCANDEGHAFPSVRYIARHLGLATNTVIKHLRSLEKHRLITITLRRDAAGDRDTTEYALLTPPILETEEGVSKNETPRRQTTSSPINNRGSRKQVSQPLRHGGSNNDTPEHAEVSQKMRHGVTTIETPERGGVSQKMSRGVSTIETFKDQENNKPKDKDLTHRHSLSSLPGRPGVTESVCMTPMETAYVATKDLFTAAFQRIWDAYPGPKDRQRKTAEIWYRAKLDKRVDEILAKVAQLKATDWSTLERRYIPKLYTWLSDGCYDDPLVEAEKPAPPDNRPYMY